MSGARGNPTGPTSVALQGVSADALYGPMEGMTWLHAWGPKYGSLVWALLGCWGHLVSTPIVGPCICAIVRILGGLTGHPNALFFLVWLGSGPQLLHLIYDQTGLVSKDFP